MKYKHCHEEWIRLLTQTHDLMNCFTLLIMTFIGEWPVDIKAVSFMFHVPAAVFCWRCCYKPKCSGNVWLHWRKRHKTVLFLMGGLFSRQFWKTLVCKKKRKLFKHCTLAVLTPDLWLTTGFTQVASTLMPAVFNRFIIFQDKCLGADWVWPPLQVQGLVFYTGWGQKMFIFAQWGGQVERRTSGRVDEQGQFLDGFLCSGLYTVLV